MTGTLALVPTMLQNLMDYPALTTGLVTAPRGVGSMVAMFLVAPLINRVDNRLIILFGLLLTAVAMWQMSQFSLQMGMAPVVISGLLQGFGLGCTQVPLNIIALSTLPRHILTQGTAIRSLMRNLGGSVGISILVATLAQNTQVVHSRLVEGLRPDNPLAQAPYLAEPFSLSTPSGMAALNAEVTRQAAMVAYVDDFKLIMLIALASIPLLLLLREARRRPPPTAAVSTAEGLYWESVEEIPEPHGFEVTITLEHDGHAHTYETQFSEHDHGHARMHEQELAPADDPLYAPLRGETAVLTRHIHLHRHGRGAPHGHWHDHLPATVHPIAAELTFEPPLHEHHHKTSARTALILILGSSPMVEGIPAFFARQVWARPHCRHGAGVRDQHDRDLHAALRVLDGGIAARAVGRV